MALESMIKIPPRINAGERAQRLDALRAGMEREGLGGVMLTPGANMRYMAGLAWGETERLVCALVERQRVTFVCPRFEATSLAASVGIPIDDVIYWEEHENPHGIAADLLKQRGVRRVGLDTRCSFAHADALFSAADDIEWRSAAAVIAPLRACKSSAELALMSAAKQITLSVHQQVFECVRLGVRPSEVRSEIDRLHRAAGADNGSSFCAVQFGAATSHPHGVPGDPPLQGGDLVLIDTGCTVDGYNSDITRTYAIDKVDDEIERVWDIEKEAQAVGFAAAKPGVSCQSIDQIVRTFLEAHDLGPDYRLPGLPHRVGHGVGLEIHEGPYLVRGDETNLAPGMCLSNEPMIVFPDRFGVRLEDHFYVTADAAAWFTEPQKSLYEPF